MVLQHCSSGGQRLVVLLIGLFLFLGGIHHPVIAGQVWSASNFLQMGAGSGCDRGSYADNPDAGQVYATVGHDKDSYAVDIPYVTTGHDKDSCASGPGVGWIYSPAGHDKDSYGWHSLGGV